MLDWVLGCPHHGVGRTFQLGEIKAAVAQLDLHREAAGIADALNRRRRQHRVPPSSIDGEAVVERLDRAMRDPAPLPLRLQSLSMM